MKYVLVKIENRMKENTRIVYDWKKNMLESEGPIIADALLIGKITIVMHISTNVHTTTMRKT